MAITVFTGSGPYNSYISLEDATDYLSVRNVDAWMNANTSDQQAALIRATDYIDLIYQPKDKAENIDLLARATVNLAISALIGPLVVEAEREVVETEEELSGVAKMKTRFSEKDFDRFPFVSQMLRPISTAFSRGRSYSVEIKR